MKASVTISDALADKDLLGASLGDLSTWSTWLAVLKTAFGIALDADELATFKQVAGDREPPNRRVRELWAVVGRRSGKSRMAAALAVFIACLTDARSRLAPGEQGYVLVLAPSVAQAKVIFDYTLGFIEASPLLASQLDGEPTQTEIRLRGGVTIAMHPASFRTVRGRTLLACIADETAYWRDETSALPDLECYRAVMPALATVNGMWIGIGSPYRRIGLMHQKHRDHFGHDGDDVLVVAGPSRTFNPLLAQEVVDAAERDDPEAARSEWFAEFRSDLSALLSDEVIDGSIDYSRPLELPPRRGVTYHVFADPSGGRHDGFGICVGHIEDGTFIADALRLTKPPFDVAATVAEYVALAKSYHCHKIVGDGYAASWVATAFKDAGASYEQSALPKSQLYLESMPLFNQGKIRVPDMPHLLRELRLLERRVHRSGRDSVDHPRGGSDDLANALCGCVQLAVMAGNRTGYATNAPETGPRCGLIPGKGYASSAEPWPPEPLACGRIRFVSVDEHGNELTADQVRALNRAEIPNRRAG
jgi:hypothetical protein